MSFDHLMALRSIRLAVCGRLLLATWLLLKPVEVDRHAVTYVTLKLVCSGLPAGTANCQVAHSATVS